MSKLSLLLQVKQLTEEAAKSIRLKISAPHKVVGKGEFEVIATTESIDRDGEVLSLDGWEFDNYMLNPVVLWSHDLYSLPLGIVTELRKENGNVIVKGVFADTEEGQKVRKLYEDGILRTVSVGYIPKERLGNVITKMELYEISFVTVPANPDAMSTRQMKAIKTIDSIITGKSDDEVKKSDEDETKGDEEKGEDSADTAKNEQSNDVVVNESHEKNDEVAKGDENMDNQSNQGEADKGGNKSVGAIYPKSTDAVKPQAKANQIDVKAGRVLSSKNIAAMQETMSEIAVCMKEKCADMLQAIIDDAATDKGIAEEQAKLKELQAIDKMLERMIVSTKQNLKSVKNSK